MSEPPGRGGWPGRLAGAAGLTVSGVSGRCDGVARSYPLISEGIQMTTTGYRSVPELADGDAVAWLRSPAGTEASRPLRLLRAAEVVAALPWRRVRSARGQAHYPGWYWSATTGGHVVYESRLELARLLLADFDSDVVAIAA